MNLIERAVTNAVLEFAWWLAWIVIVAGLVAGAYLAISGWLGVRRARRRAGPDAGKCVRCPDCHQKWYE